MKNILRSVINEFENLITVNECVILMIQDRISQMDSEIKSVKSGNPKTINLLDGSIIIDVSSWICEQEIEMSKWIGLLEKLREK